MAGYQRNDTSNNIDDGKVIDAADLDGEFDAIEDAFDSSTGHAHDGTSAEGAPIEVTGPAQEYLFDGTAIYPKTDDTYDLGKVGAEFRDLYIDGTANIDTVAADAITIGGSDVITASSPDTLVNKTIDSSVNTITVDLSEATVTGTLTQFNNALSGATFVSTGGAETLTNKILSSPDINTPDIDGGTIDGTVIGATTTANGNFSALNVLDGNLTLNRTGDATAANLNIRADDGSPSQISMYSNDTAGYVNAIRNDGTDDLEVGSSNWVSQTLLDDWSVGGTLTANVTGDLTGNADTATTLTGLTSSVAELNTLDGVTANATEINTLDGITATTTELNYTDGVTSNIQTQLDSKAASTTQAEAVWETGTSTTETIVSPAKVAAAIEAQTPDPIGVNQTWQDVAGSRLVNTAYQNTTGRPIQVSITIQSGDFQTSPDGSTWTSHGAGTNRSNITPVIPDDWYYRQNGGVVENWLELR